MPQTVGGDDENGEPGLATAGVVDEEGIESEAGDRSSVGRRRASRVEGWDVDAQILTLQQAASNTRANEKVAEPAEEGPRSMPRPVRGPPPLPRRATSPPRPGLTPSPPEAVPGVDMTAPERLIELLKTRVGVLEGSPDTVGLARAYLELSIASDVILGDESQAVAHARSALQADPAAVGAHALLRRAVHGRAALAEMADHVASELAAATTEAHRVELLTLRARLFAALGGRGREVREAWEQALAFDPKHPAALKGLEIELWGRARAEPTARDWEAIAAHLGRMADAYADDPGLAAWLQVERSVILEKKLGRTDAARSAHERSLELDGGVGPVRSAFVRHVASQADWGSLCRLLADEAAIETDGARAARCNLDAAMISAWRLGDPARATELLELALALAPTEPIVDRLVLDELIRLYEASGHWTDAARARRARLAAIVDPVHLAHELRALATAAESDGDVGAAIADVQRALSLGRAGESDLEWLDRLLARAEKNDQRIALWLHEAARSDDGPERARALFRAAAVGEAVGRPSDALRHMRSAWIADPGNDEVVEGLGRLLSPRGGEDAQDGPRSLVELYAAAAEQTRDGGRRIAYLEKVALLWEDVLGDPVRAARAYEQVLGIDGKRRSALMGLQRTASRAGDKPLLARALLEEARNVTDRAWQATLRLRAASALATHDAPRALQLVREVLERDPGHGAARALETRLHEEAARWEFAAKSMRARIDASTSPSERVTLWLALARLQHGRLRAPMDALASLEQARALDPTHPVPREETARVLETHSDAKILRETTERLAATATTADERVRRLIRAAEIDELRLGDDANAARNDLRALAETSGSELLLERLDRLTARRAKQRHPEERAEFAALLARKIDRNTAADARPNDPSFDLAWLFVESGQEPRRAVELLEHVLDTRPDHIPALRSIEGLRRQPGGDADALARVLASEAERFKDLGARLGALSNLVFLEEWGLASGDPLATYEAVLDLDPTDPAALEAVLRASLAGARRGDPQARARAIGALRSLLSLASNDSTRLELELRLALLLEAAASSESAGDGSDLLREASSRYRSILQADPLSVTAATGLARLARRLDEASSTLAAAESLSDLATDSRARARYLLEAADILLSSADPSIGGGLSERRLRAAAMLERALEADPDSVPVGGRLASVLLEDGLGERLVTAFRAALGRARSADAVVMFGSEIARVARDELHDLPLGIDAMRRVRTIAPQHVPSLLTLAELCVAQRVWPEAVEALEAVVSIGRDPAAKLTALFALASIYEKVLDRSAEVDRVLRTALAVDPSNARALQFLVRRVTAQPIEDDDPAAERRRKDLADLVGRLAEVETDLDYKSVLLVDLSEIHMKLGDRQAAEQALIDATACSLPNARAFSRLSDLFRSGDGTDYVGYARALGAVIERGERRGHLDARWFASLGHAEMEALSRPDEGVIHLQRAVDLDPLLYEARYALARAYAATKAPDKAAEVLVAMLSPNARPILSILDLSGALTLLESTLSEGRRMDESIVARELRAFAGEVDDQERDWLRLRRLSAHDPPHGSLNRTTLVTHVLPSQGRHVLLEVAAAIAGIESKLLRSDLAALGLSARERIGARSGHPIRALVDKIARKLDISDFEVATSPKVAATRIVIQDVPWIVIPTALVERDEPAQIVSIARAAARIAYGVPWIDELQPDSIEALLVAAARQSVPGYGPDSKAVAQYETIVARSLTRRQRKLLEELAPHLGSETPHSPIGRLIEALTLAELRTSFLLAGDLLAVADDVAATDPLLREALAAPGAIALASLLEHPLTGDVARFALTAESAALRHRVGTSWSR